MHRAGCCRQDHPAFGRRDLLQVGGLSLVGMGLADLLRLEAQAAQGAGDATGSAKAKSVVFIFQSGGPSQHETFDPKPTAPAGIRGEYGITQTRLAGVRFCEYLPRLAARADRFSIVRTMHHTAEPRVPQRAQQLSLPAAHRHDRAAAGRHQRLDQSAAPGRIEWPSIGSMIAYAAPPRARSAWPAVVEIAAGQPHDVSRPRARHARPALRALGRRPGAAVPRAGRRPARARTASATTTRTTRPAPPGTGPKAWWDNSSCRDADFHLPELGCGRHFDPAAVQPDGAVAAAGPAPPSCGRGADRARFGRLGRPPPAGAAPAAGRAAGQAEPVRPDAGAGPRPRPLRPRGVGPGFPRRAAAGRGRRAHGAGQPARLGHAPERLPRPEGQAAAVDRPLPERLPRRPGGARACSTRRWS